MYYRNVYKLPAFQLTTQVQKCVPYLCAAAVFLVAGALMALYAPGITIALDVCADSTVTFLGVAFALYAIADTVLNYSACAVCTTHLVHKDAVYTTALLHPQLVHCVTSIIMALLSAHVVYMQATVLSHIYMAWSVMKLVQHALKFIISKRTVWSAYQRRIELSVFKRAVIANVHTFITGGTISKVLHKSAVHEVGLYSIHQSLQVLGHETETSDEDGPQIYTALCSHVRGASRKVRVFRKATSPQRPRPSIIQQESETGELTLAELQAVIPLEAAREIMRLFDADADGQISSKEFCTVLLEAAKDRQYLFQSLDDYACMVETLDNVIGWVAQVVHLFVVLWIAGVDIIQKQIGIISIIVLFSFAYGSTLQKLFEGCILVFIWRPYDVNDRIYVTDVDTSLVVRRISLLATEFERGIDGQTMSIPNSLLQCKSITNTTRSGPSVQAFTLRVPSEAQLELDRLQQVALTRAQSASRKVRAVTLQVSGVREDGISTCIIVKVFHTTNGHNVAEHDLVRYAISEGLHDAMLKTSSVQNSVLFGGPVG